MSTVAHLGIKARIWLIFLVPSVALVQSLYLILFFAALFLVSKLSAILFLPIQSLETKGRPSILLSCSCSNLIEKAQLPFDLFRHQSGTFVNHVECGLSFSLFIRPAAV